MSEKPEVKTFKVPEGVEKYKEIDLKLLPGENVERIVSMSPLSKARSYLICSLLALLGLMLYMLFSGHEVTAWALAPPIAVFLATYFVWSAGVTKDLKGLFYSVVKYAVGLVVLCYVLAFLVQFFSPYLSMLEAYGFPAPKDFRFSADPVENAESILAYLASLVNSYVMAYAPLLRLASLGLVACSIVAAVLAYMSCRGQLYYVTDRRIVARRKFGTVQVTTLPLDGLVEVTAFQGFFGRLFGYGDIVLSMVSSGGVASSLRPQLVQPIGSFCEVKRRLEGVKDVWELKDAIITLRDKYVEARYLERIEGELKRIREAVEEKEKPPWVRAKEEKQYVA